MTAVAMYDDFIRRKSLENVPAGFDPDGIGSHLFDFQTKTTQSPPTPSSLPMSACLHSA